LLGTDFYNTEPSEQKPTEKAVVTEEVQDESPEIEAKEQPEKSESEASESDETKAQYIELDGDEVNLDDVREWRDKGLMQKDYTKKTTALSSERKEFETERETFRETTRDQTAKLTEMSDMLTVLVNEDEATDWVALKEADPEKYIELKEKSINRKEALEKVRAEKVEDDTQDPAFIAVEQQKLHKANPEWLDDDGKITDTFKADTRLMDAYATNAGFTSQEFNRLTAAQLTTILKAAKYDQLQEKGRKIKDKRDKVPVVTKPKGKVTTEQSGDAATVLYG